MRYALGLQYDGSRYAGWQSQLNDAGVRTLQTEVQNALSSIACDQIDVICSGRTDAGVHALQQVVHFDTAVVRPMQAWLRGGNAQLPKDMSIRWVKPMPDGFHARYSARARRYTYVLISDPIRPALSHLQAGWTHLSLSLPEMQEAARLLLGEHDFSTFRASQCQAKTPVRTLSELNIVQNGNVYYMHFEANAFLHHMVRNIVGALVYVGSKRWTIEQFKHVFDAKDRKLGAPTFWPDGLYFCGPVYQDYEVPAPIEVSPVLAWPWAL